MPSVLQDWVQELPYMQQSVLISSIRGPDGLHKEHIAKYILRWVRRCVLLSAFDGKVLETPTESGGGSFTGPLKHPESDWERVRKQDIRDREWLLEKDLNKIKNNWDLRVLDAIMKEYIRSVDEIPHHFHMHVMHAAEILGYKHPVQWKREWWHKFYLAMVNDAHLHPETKEEMDRRLGDVESQWREREAVPAADVPLVK